MEQGRIFKRKIYEKMLRWKSEKDGKTALLIRGARRVGKSTIAEEFAKREYVSYIKVDFAEASEELWEVCLKRYAPILTAWISHLWIP